MSIHFYDTSALLSNEKYRDEYFYLSSVTLKELEDIKTSRFKDNTIKYRARKLTHYLAENPNKYKIITYSDNAKYCFLGTDLSYLDENNDSKIIYCALYLLSKGEDVVFHTKDLSCANLATLAGLTVFKEDEISDNYTGFKETILNEEELAHFYENIQTFNNPYGLLENEYLIIKDENGTVVDKYVFENGVLRQVQFTTCKSDQFGNVKPKDVYQEIAFDALKHRKTILLRGAAGTGKSLLACSYLFYLMEKGKIDKIIIFSNTVATADSAKLGFYPGTRDEKLLDSQIGNFLVSKLGDKFYVEDLVTRGKLLLMPMSDSRGFDTTGMNAGIYITEAQNLSANLMQLALQRSDDDSIFIIDGDDKTQVDSSSFEGDNNGIKALSRTFRGDSDYAEVTLQNIYRSHRAELAQHMTE